MSENQVSKNIRNGIEPEQNAAPRKRGDSKDDGGNKVWLIPYNKKYFDLKGCYDKFHEVYWTQHCRFKADDTGYIYGSSPESAIRFSFEIAQSDMPYDPIMDFENEFQRESNSSEPAKFYAHMKLTGETKTRRLSLVNLLDRGLKSAPMGAVNLSKPEFKELLEYINDNF